MGSLFTKTALKLYSSGTDSYLSMLSKADTPVELSKTEQKLLRLLVENRGITLNRTVLLNRIWTDGTDYVDENALSVAIKRLWDKLDAARHIKTVYGLGYVWVVKQDE